jgi:hypothetical protein
MTRVCLLGNEDCTLQYELLSRETAREALATYELREPFENAVGVETVSLGGAVALLNDLDWYLRRFVEEALVLEPSVSDEEWLSRELATAVRNDEVSPAESGRFLKIYGVEHPGSPADGSGGPDEDTAGPTDETDQQATRSADVTSERPPRLVEPMFVTRTGEDLPAYDLREVEETLVERVTESEFGP